MTTDAPATVDFIVLLLGALGHVDGEFTSLIYENGDRPHTAVIAPADAVTAVPRLPKRANSYFGVNPTAGPARTGGRRGSEADVTRLAALWCDLDIKPGACESLDVARAIVANLSITLNTRPSITVESGHGLHAYWPVEDGAIGDQFTTGQARALLRRWGRLVAAVAEKLHVHVDNVFDLSRMLRIPGTFNNKNTNGQGPLPVTAHEDNGGPLTVAEIDERLTELGIDAEPGDTDTAETVSDSETWTWAEQTCGYVAKLIDGLAADGPPPNGSGRHPWLCSQSVRLACACRLGCLTEADLQRALEALGARFAQLCTAGEPQRAPGRFEVAAAWRFGIERASTKTDEAARAELGGHRHDDEPEDQPVDPAAADADGAELLDRVHAALTKYVAFHDEHQPVAVTLWTAATHGLSAWQHATRLVITSPTKRCGKSRLLDIIAGLSFKRLLCGDISAAAAYRSIGDDDEKTPTLMLDEADVQFGTKRTAEQNEDLRGLFNNGWQRNRPTTRCVGPQQTPTDFDTFAMAALASKGRHLPDTITDRAVNIALDRRTSGQKVARFRIRRDEAPLAALRPQLTAWVRASLDTLAAAEFELPGVEDRALDAWEPLLAIADAAGGDWPRKARAACRALNAAAVDADDDLGVLLLADVRQVFKESGHSVLRTAAGDPFLPSATLVGELRAVEESPWADEKSDTYLTVGKLAARLKPFGVKPVRNSAGNTRGYALSSFRAAFARYLQKIPSDRQENDADH